LAPPSQDQDAQDDGGDFLRK